MSYDKITQEKKDQLTHRAISTNILQHMNHIRNGQNTHLEQQWLWELIKNAKNCAYPGQPVAIRLELYPDKFVFSHNGRPFGVQNLLALISQISYQFPEIEGTQNSYGTGFLRSHILSEKVNLTSILQDFDGETGARLPVKAFSLDLDRSGATAEAIAKAIDRGVSFLQNLDETPTITPDLEAFNTVFTYPLLLDASKKIVKNAIRDFDISVGYVFAFSPNLSEIQFIDHIDHNTAIKKDWKRAPEESWNNTFLNTFSHITCENGITRQHHLLLARQDKLTIALPFHPQKQEFAGISPQTPRLFADIPLLDSADFPLPFVCNHPLFHCNQTNTSIPLTSSQQSPASVENKKIIRKAMELFNEYMLIAKTGNCEKFYHAFQFLPLPSHGALDNDWMTEEIHAKMHFILKEVPLIQKTEGVTSLLPELKFPYASTQEEAEDIWSILEKIPSFQIPRLEDVLCWYEALTGYDSLVQQHFISLEYIANNGNDPALFPVAQHYNPMQFFQLLYNGIVKNETLCSGLNKGAFTIFPDETPALKLHNATQIFVAPQLDEPIEKALALLNAMAIKKEENPDSKSFLHPKFKLQESTPLSQAPMEHYLQCLSTIYDVNYAPIPTNPEDDLSTFKLQRTEALGFLLLTHPDPFWLRVYQKFLNPTFYETHAPSSDFDVTQLNPCLYYLMATVADFIEKCYSLEKFKDTFFPQEDTLAANTFLSEFLENCWEIWEDIYDYKIFPDQYGAFHFADDISNDLNIHSTLKNIAKLLKEEGVSDYFSLLFHTDFPPMIYTGVKQKTNDNIALDISRGILPIITSHSLASARESTQEACLQLLAWMETEPVLVKELFPAFSTEEERMRLMTPHTATLIQRKIQAYQDIMAEYRLESLEDLSYFLTRLHQKSEVPSGISDHIHQDEDVFIDFHEHPELYPLGESARANYVMQVQKTGEMFARNFLIEKWEKQGFETVKTGNPSLIILEKEEDMVELFTEDPKNAREHGWNISESLNQAPPTYYQVKSTTSQSRCESIDLSHAQANLAFTCHENYCVLRYFLSTDLKTVLSFREITHILDNLRDKKIFFAGNKPSLWLNP